MTPRIKCLTNYIVHQRNFLPWQLCKIFSIFFLFFFYFHRIPTHKLKHRTTDLQKRKRQTETALGAKLLWRPVLTPTMTMNVVDIPALLQKVPGFLPENTIAYMCTVPKSYRGKT